MDDILTRLRGEGGPLGELDRTAAAEEIERLRVLVRDAMPEGADDMAPQLVKVAAETRRAENRHVPMASAHEAYAIILEEVDELWAEVKVRQSKHDPDRIEAELTQIAAMAVRAMRDVVPRIRARRAA